MTVVNPLPVYVLFYRAVALAIIGAWAYQLFLALRRPGDRRSYASRLPRAVSSVPYVYFCLAGIAAGIGVLIFSFVYFG